jgi:(E)-4-hydroxy-3-methylbut-2-enyl-diphosphate synthase
MAETTFAPWVYCPSLTRYERWKTRAVRIGDIGIGGDNPIRVQSMTTTDTMDTAGTVAQSIRMIEAGCELVRITAPSKKEAENLAEIKKKLVAAGYKTPLVADIHFTPECSGDRGTHRGEGAREPRELRGQEEVRCTRIQRRPIRS